MLSVCESRLEVDRPAEEEYDSIEELKFCSLFGN